MGFFRTWDETGKNLVDSDYVTFGLIKSGYMTYLTSVEQKRREFINNNTYYPTGIFDSIYGFTVTAEAPIVFVAGRAVLQQIVRTGNSFTYWYAHASASVRYYVFDLMRDRDPGPAKLRLWDDAGVCTLDTGMPFMDINGSAVAPPPSTFSGVGRGYVGATTTVLGEYGWGRSVMDTISFPATGDCAVSNQWSRAMFHATQDGTQRISAKEGAYGAGGRLVFAMATEAGCLIDPFFNPPHIVEYGFFDIPTARLPSASYIDASTLPLPFG
ncbi:hypothetical protein [Stutzerimonas stutzeri]|uniref:Uncharacterized protein n=1 Tax=Stutzerimonas stutzeri TaxID=316 RepID=A0AA42P710_STUST|nr:hypothetical protein [Stutzerimonas stutzeri]MDH1234497.1 hypothetical protein [Stutzerimonas stutzeri]